MKRDPFPSACCFVPAGFGGRLACEACARTGGDAAAGCWRDAGDSSLVQNNRWACSLAHKSLPPVLRNSIIFDEMQNMCSRIQSPLASQLHAG